MSDKSTLLERLGIAYPVIQAPMAGVSTPELAAAVSQGGGLGSLGLGASTVTRAREMIRATRALTDKPFNVNLFCHVPAQRDATLEAAWLTRLKPLFAEFGAEPPASLSEIYPSFNQSPAMLDMLLEEKPAVVSFHFGLPPVAWLEALGQAGMVRFGCATNLAEARAIEQAGLDVVVAQGVEAGGHRGVFDPDADEQLGTLALVRLLVRQGRLPVIAAGGIMDGAAIAAVMELGAQAAQLGTAFVLCPETSASAAYREALQSPRSEHTRITRVISGRPARGLVNRMMTELEQAGAPCPPSYPVAYDAGKALHQAAAACGNHEFAAHWAGQGAPLARAMPAAELLETLVSEWQAST